MNEQSSGSDDKKKPYDGKIRDLKKKAEVDPLINRDPTMEELMRAFKRRGRPLFGR